MFIRASRSGGHTYLRLVESYRDADGKNRHKQHHAPYSVERAFHHLKSLQRHRVRCQDQTLTGLTTLTPEQKALFKGLDIPTPTIAAL